MKAVLRLFLKPSVFFNQLQWSRSHWIFLVALGLFAMAETRTGAGAEQYAQLVRALQAGVGLSLDAAVWAVNAFRLSLMFAAVYVMTSLIWIVGNVIGERNSKRVLFRRLAVVATVFLGGSCLQNLAAEHAWLILFSSALYVWGTVLGFYAIKEQFNLSSAETAIVTALAALVIASGLHLGDEAAEIVAGLSPESEAPALTHRPGSRFELFSEE